ncbi:amidohydrolase [Rhodovulum sp. MB263]|uniref:amidohydrolase family protein n=1 Tax=Rhodovulum sp. (strain MB263) TaxID=308754 RepID=UPI0009B7A4C6|nr:amidohydrolase family protein [Rhodovulum sp. MB263]ARC90305.1 thioesterase [Rhodovulum sp. MB263]
MTRRAGAETVQIVDAHCHMWDLSLGRHPWLAEGVLHPHRYGDYSEVKRDYLPADYRAATRPWTIAAAVHMEAEWTPEDPLGEARWIADLHAKTGFPAAMTAQVWLDRPGAHELIAAQAAFPLVRSLRHKPKAFARAADWHEAHALAGSMRCPDFRRGYAGLAAHGLHFELQTPFWHLPDAAELARDFPETMIVINHAGVPGSRDPAVLADWRRALSVAAARPNIRIKISGLGVPGEAWTTEAQREVILTCIEIFGAGRAMFASNMPVDGMFRSFPDLIADFMAVTSDLPEADRRAFFAGTAAHTYGLDLPGLN